jgi:outer membrane protein TolC
MTKYILALVLLAGGSAGAQERLTLQDAISRTLQHNYDIAIAATAQQQAAANNTYGNAGFLPNINAGVSGSQSRQNVQSDLANGSQQNNPNAINTNINPNITVNWTIYDGGRMFLVKKQLTQLEVLSSLQQRVQMQAAVSRIIQMYATVVLQQKQLIAVDTALHLATVRMRLAELKYRTGAGAKVDYLQARVDYNARQADSLTYLSSFAQACDSMSVLMGENEDKLYVVDDSLMLNTHLQPLDKERLRDVNLSLAAFRRSADIAHINEDIARSFRLPTVALNGGYVYNRSTSATGFALFSQSYGANGSVNLSVPVFQGGNLRRQSKVASLQAIREELIYNRQYTVVGRQYRTSWRNYSLAVAAYNLANENLQYAKENLDVQLARFRVGVGTTLESREAENAYVQALIRLYTAQFNVKTNETLVLELENRLVDELE